jgi:hypothetical protein
VTAIRELAATPGYQPEANDTVDPDMTADRGLTDGFPPTPATRRWFRQPLDR